jgi:hypothetical protein
MLTRGRGVEASNDWEKCVVIFTILVPCQRTIVYPYLVSGSSSLIFADEESIISSVSPSISSLLA